MKREDVLRNIFEVEDKIKRLRICSELGLAGPMEIGILSVISESGGKLKVSEISNRINSTMPNVSRALKSMEKEGKILRTVDDNDRRNTMVTITEDGKRYLNENLWAISRFMASALSRLSIEDLENYSNLLGKIYSAYRRELCGGENTEKGGINV